MTRSIQRPIKRLLDIFGSAFLLVVTSPIAAVAALLIRARLGSPVLFRQVRLGVDGRPFPLIKFRTMTDAVDDAGVVLPDEERMTPLGRKLRELSLDELPELVNVLKGDMSLVGPRPLLPEYRDLYSSEQWRRHEVRPGIAGPVLAKGRNALSWQEKLALDVWYVDHWSLWVDAKIVVQTLKGVLRREGISAEGHATMPRFEGTKE